MAFGCNGFGTFWCLFEDELTCGNCADNMRKFTHYEVKRSHNSRGESGGVYDEFGVGVVTRPCPSCRFPIGVVAGTKDAICKNCGFKDPCCE